MEAYDTRIRERILQRVEALIDRIEFIERHMSDAMVNYPSLKGGACERLNKTKQFD